MASISELLVFQRMGWPYLLHPLVGLEVFLPNKWPVSLFLGGNSFDPAQEIGSLAGKVILVTGGNAGLGAETIYQLARHNPQKIYLAARSAEKANKALEEVQRRLLEEKSETADARTPDQTTIEFLELDLSNFSSIQKAADSVLHASEQRLDLVFLNAGVMASAQKTTQQGYNIQLGTNHIGHHLLTKLLLPLLQSTAAKAGSDVRVITVSSEANNMAPLDFLQSLTSTPDGPKKFLQVTDYECYGISKSCNILFAAELARRYGGEGITSVSVHPGLILTSLYDTALQSNSAFNYMMTTMASLMFDTVRQGALTQLWCAAGAEKDTLTNGGYYTPVKRLRDNRWSGDIDNARVLWEWTETELAKQGF